MKIIRFLLICSVFQLGLTSISYSQGARLYEITPPALQLEAKNAITANQTNRIKEIERNPTTISTFAIKIERNALNNNIIKVPLPNGQEIELFNIRRENVFPKIQSWIGRGKEDTIEGIFTIGPERIGGTISAGLYKYIIHDVGNGAGLLVISDPKKLPDSHGPDAPDRPSKKKLALSKDGKKSEENTITASGSGPIVIDLLVAYIPASIPLMDGGPEYSVAAAVSQLNSALSSVDGQQISVRLVDFFEISINDNGLSTAKMAAIFRDSPITKTRMKASGADLGIVISSYLPNYCGYALSIGPNITDSFAAVHASCLNRSVAFQHEFGHLLGAQHEITSDATGVSYAHGYFINASESGRGCFPSIVSDKVSTCENPPGNFYSNPRRTTYIMGACRTENGIGKCYPSKYYPTGNASTADNARIMAETAATVASFSDLRARAAQQAAEIANIIVNAIIFPIFYGR